jgi:hypothetical protein
MRTSRSQVEGLFKTFTKACGRRVATAYNDVGGWGLDYSEYGGYVIYEVANSGGAQHQPFGHERRKGQEMWYAMHFALRTIETLRSKPRTDPRRRVATARRWSRR